RRDIIEQLGLSDERYNEVANELSAAESVKKNRGRAGGLTLLVSGRAKAARAEPDEAPLERELYAPFERYLVKAAEEADESRSVVIRSHQRRGAKWETPDLCEVRVTPFPMIGQWELRLAAYELKRQGG